MVQLRSPCQQQFSSPDDARRTKFVPCRPRRTINHVSYELIESRISFEINLFRLSDSIDENVIERKQSPEQPAGQSQKRNQVINRKLNVDLNLIGCELFMFFPQF